MLALFSFAIFVVVFVVSFVSIRGVIRTARSYSLKWSTSVSNEEQARIHTKYLRRHGIHVDPMVKFPYSLFVREHPAFVLIAFRNKNFLITESYVRDAISGKQGLISTPLVVIFVADAVTAAASAWTCELNVPVLHAQQLPAFADLIKEKVSNLEQAILELRGRNLA